jgi:hypothetical protein
MPSAVTINQKPRYKWARKVIESAVPGDITRAGRRHAAAQLEQVKTDLSRLRDVDQERHRMLGHVATS